MTKKKAGKTFQCVLYSGKLLINGKIAEKLWKKTEKLLF
jgi:hypothetical protein